VARIKWSNEFEREMNEVLAALTRRKDRQPFAGLSAAELEALRNQPFAQWLRTFLPEQFRSADAPFHAEADRRMDTVGVPIGNCWFGGAGKTWRYVIAKGVYRICHGSYICRRRDGSMVCLPSHEANDPTRDDLVSKVRIGLRVIGCRNLRKAAEKVALIRLLLKHSAELRAAYGEAIEPSEGEDAETDFTANGVRTVALGIESDLRGVMQISGPRVQEIDLDDIENNEIAASKEREEKITDQIFMGWLARCEKGGQEAILNAQMNQYRSRHCQARQWKAMAAEIDPETGKPKAIFHVVALDDGEFHSNWPAHFSDATCRRLAFQFGTLRYNVEFRCREVNEDSLIKPEWFKEFSVARLPQSELDGMTIVAALDPSHKAEQGGDYKAWVVMGRKRGARAPKFLLHAWLKRTTPVALVEEQWRIEDRFPTARMVMENEAVFDFYGELYYRMCRDAGRSPRRIVPIRHTGAKVDRIVTDAGEIERGEWFVDVQEGQQALVVDQYGELPKKGAHDDGPDAAEMASAGLDGALAWEGEPTPEPTRADLLAEARIERWNTADNPAIWEEVTA
jgi:hypothetical protein